MGIQQIQDVEYIEGGLTTGYLPFRPKRGGCVVRCSTPTVWPFVARALGFDVMRVDTTCKDFRSLVEEFFPELRETGEAIDTPPVVIVMGQWSFFSQQPPAYWAQNLVPHVISLSVAEQVTSPEGFTFVTHSLHHDQVGGATSGVFGLGILVPSDLVMELGKEGPPPLPVQAPSALCNVLNSTVWGRPFQDERGLAALKEPVPLGSPPSYVQRLLNPHGLAPSQGLASLLVLAPCVFSQSGWSSRRLSHAEVAGAFDVPILVQDYLKRKAGPGIRLLEELCRDHPGKILHLGTDYLLSVYCRGGLVDSSIRESEAPKSLSHPWLERIREAAGIAARQRDQEEEMWLGVKQEGQKADDATVPIHLWDGMWMLSREWEGLPSMEGWWGKPFEIEKASGLPRWRWSLNKFRTVWLIRRWRRNVTRSLSQYLRELTLTRRPGKHVWWKGSDNKYVWGNDGRVNYTLEWKDMRKESRGSEMKDMLQTGREALSRTSNSTWWDWDEGSTLLFWRWPDSHSRWALKGQPHFVTGKLPRFTKAQRKASTPEAQQKVNVKVNKVRSRLYICPGYVASLTQLFDVPKGLTDIRVVYNGTESGLNDQIFAPHFTLPVVRNTLRSLLERYYSADLDVGEMFLNFPLAKELRPYAGVDVTHMRHTKSSELEDWEEGRSRSWERWVRNFMGLRDSPYRSLQLMIKAKHIAYGKRKDGNNPFQWVTVVLNLPGSQYYDPTLPWVMKVRKDGHLACEVYIYVDDGKFTGWSKLECWKAVQRFSKVLTGLGIQDAYRKRTGPSTTPGPWAGTVTVTEGGVFATVTVLKWEKTQSLVKEMRQMMEENDEALSRKRLEEIRGFLIYVSRTYHWMNPYLKGLHLTIDAWRSGRDNDGYRMKQEIQLLMADREFEKGDGEGIEGYGDKEHAEDEHAPEKVKAVPRFEGDISALEMLTEGEVPALQKCRVREAMMAVYLMGDASGRGVGAALWDMSGVRYTAGSWTRDCSQESSNWREAKHLTEKILEMAKEGLLNDKELFVFTDNMTYESTFYKGHSKSKKLTDIILQLRKAERESGCILHVVHIAGTRMKEAGVDGLSRSDFMEGIMRGDDPWSFIPLNEDADERSGGRVSAWVRQWWNDENGQPWTLPMPKEGDEDIPGREDYPHSWFQKPQNWKGGAEEERWESGKLHKLNPEDWFRLHEIKGHRLWIPPPAAMITVMEQFAEDHLVNPHLTHVFVIPRLMTYLWRKHLFKDADVSFYVQAGAPFWPRSMHEPLTVAVVFPLAHAHDYRGPWVVKRRPNTREIARKLEAEFKRSTDNGREEFLNLDRKMPNLQEEAYRWTWNLLRQFLHEQRAFPPVQSGLLRGVLQGLRGESISRPKKSRRRGKGPRKRVRGGRGD